MVNPYMFREYDIRGVADEDFSDDIVYLLGKTLGTYFLRNNVNNITLGRDCRLSSPRIHKGLSQGVLDTGCNIVDIGIVPSPLLYFSLFQLDMNGGLMITGSHNPPDNNGLKVCLGKGTIHGGEIQNIRKMLERGEFDKGKGALQESSIVDSYLEKASGFLRMGDRQCNVIVDSGNGTGGIVAGPLYRKLGAGVTELFCEMDGTFPNHHPDPTVPANLEALITKVREQKADLGIAFDGDSDRIGVVDEAGTIIWGDQLMILFSRAILKEKRGATFIAEVKCSQTLFDDIENIYAIKEATGSLERTIELTSSRPDLVVVSGDDAIDFPMLAQGAKGFISVTANLVPNLKSSIVQAINEGNYKEAKRINDLLFPLNKSLFVEANPIPIKAAMYLAGLIDTLEYRLPLTPPSTETMRLLEEVIKNYEIIK